MSEQETDGAVKGVVDGAYNTRMVQRRGQRAGKSRGRRVPGLTAERTCHPLPGSQD